METKNIYKELDEVQVDEKANIKVTLMTGDKDISVFAAEIAPDCELNPHYHKEGIETYQVLQGSGFMHVGNLKDNSVEWTEKFEVTAGDCFSIEANQVHQIINPTKEKLLAIFTCPAAHLGNDRFFVSA